MPVVNDRLPDDDPPDLLDRIPGFNRTGTRLQQTLGPSCLLSLVITALILVVVRRYLRLPITASIVLTIFIWWGVLVVLLRFGGPVEDDE